MMVLDIAGNELRRLFLSPLAWMVAAITQFLLAFFFIFMLIRFLEPGAWNAGQGLTSTVVAGTFQIAAMLLLLLAPFLTMRLFSEELRSGTMPLLLSSPVTLTELVLGKFLGMGAFFLCLLVLIAVMPLSLAAGTSLDMGHLAAGLFGLFLLLWAFAAIGLLISTLTAQPVVAAAGSFAALFVFWIIHIGAHAGNEKLAAVLNWLSLQRHFQNLVEGLFSSVDVAYYLLLILTCICLSIWRLETMRTHD